MRWGETLTLQFVKIYLKHECLWNPLHLSYKNRSERESAYLKIISEFKASGGASLSIPEAKIKIKNLRTTYVQEMRKVLNKSSPDHIYEPSLVWFPEMDKCLKNIIIPRSFQAVSNTFTLFLKKAKKVVFFSDWWCHKNSKNLNSCCCHVCYYSFLLKQLIKFLLFSILVSTTSKWSGSRLI